jgi:hypothetical protein
MTQELLKRLLPQRATRSRQPRWLRRGALVLLLGLIAASAGCQLDAIRGKNRVGTEWRHGGTTNTNHERHTVQQGVVFSWENGVDTGLTYRRRDDNDGPGDNDNALFIDVSYPLWTRPQPRNPQALKIAELERRLAELERRQAAEKHSTEPRRKEAVSSNPHPKVERPCRN